ncbi:hypothetical protein AB2N04_17940 [Nitratireductor sp. GISD-1A_MAKvit]|uniref:hypothetical protein n=1 Tax=Nitratireductor sp. GISD-1A_MAKvit TaxID=3234198 RepID=UPI0034654142
MNIKLLSIFAASLFTLPALAIEPLPNSITADGPTKSALKSTPVGSLLHHEIYHQGNRYTETYVVGADGRLVLVSRSLRSD